MKIIGKFTAIFACVYLSVAATLAASQEAASDGAEPGEQSLESKIQQKIGSKIFTDESQKVRLQFNSRDKLYHIANNSYSKTVEDVQIEEGKNNFKAIIKLSGDNSEQEFTRSLKGKFILYQTIAVPNRDIKKGELISEDDLSYISVYSSQVQNSTIVRKEDVKDKEAKLNLKAGKILQNTQFKDKPLVRAGGKVTLEYANKNISLKASGVALGDGARGEKIRVRNSSSNKIVNGIVQERGVVKVEEDNED
jgi:flagella basal body P-ring formation protein FlgA